MKSFIKILSILLFLNLSLSAVDISEFEIDGIKLGETYSNVKKRLSCNAPLNNIGSYNILYILECSSLKIDVRFDKSKRLIEISKFITFSSKLDWRNIKTKLYKKYGKPIDDSDKSGNNNTGNISYQAVWGAYPLNYEYSYQNGIEIEGKGLQIILFSHNPSSMSLTLVDGNKLKKVRKELARAEKLEEAKKRNREIENAF